MDVLYILIVCLPAGAQGLSWDSLCTDVGNKLCSDLGAAQQGGLWVILMTEGCFLMHEHDFH